MATEKRPIVISTAGIIKKKLVLKFKTVEFPPCSVYSNTTSSGTKFMSCSQKVFGRTVDKKCLVI